MTPWQIEVLNRYEPELRPGLEPLDRSIELPLGALGFRLREVRHMLAFSEWSPDKILAFAICYLVAFGFDPEWEGCDAKAGTHTPRYRPSASRNPTAERGITVSRSPEPCGADIWPASSGHQTDFT